MSLALDPSRSECSQAGEGIPPAAEEFAKRHGLWDATLRIASGVPSLPKSSDLLKLELAVDPEEEDWRTLCLVISTIASVEAALALDGQIGKLIDESVSRAHSLHFAVRLNLVA